MFPQLSAVGKLDRIVELPLPTADGLLHAAALSSLSAPRTGGGDGGRFSNILIRLSDILK